MNEGVRVSLLPLSQEVSRSTRVRGDHFLAAGTGVDRVRPLRCLVNRLGDVVAVYVESALLLRAAFQAYSQRATSSIPLQ